jgi:hypothetical protein
MRTTLPAPMETEDLKDMSILSKIIHYLAEAIVNSRSKECYFPMWIVAQPIVTKQPICEMHKLFCVCLGLKEKEI